jgi:hypothetical protein
MSRDIAAEIEKKYGDIQFYYPKIYFAYNSIELSGILSFLEKIYFIIPLLFIWIPIFLLDSFGFTIFFLAGYIYYCYEKVFVLDAIKIDFLRKEIQISNKFPGINLVRKIFKKPVLISFHEITEFKTYKRMEGLFVPRGNVLVVKTYDHSPIKIAQFRFERESGRLSELLNEYIVGKARIFD